MPRRSNNNNRKTDSSKPQSFSIKSIPSKHNVRLSGQGQWVRIYFFIVPNRSIEDCFHHSALTSLNTSYAVQRNESLQAGVGGRVTQGLGVPLTVRVLRRVLSGPSFLGCKSENTRWAKEWCPDKSTRLGVMRLWVLALPFVWYLILWRSLSFFECHFFHL